MANAELVCWVMGRSTIHAGVQAVYGLGRSGLEWDIVVGNGSSLTGVMNLGQLGEAAAIEEFREMLLGVLPLLIHPDTLEIFYDGSTCGGEALELPPDWLWDGVRVHPLDWKNGDENGWEANCKSTSAAEK